MCFLEIIKSFNNSLFLNSILGFQTNDLLDGSCPQVSLDETAFKMIVEELIDSSSESEGEVEELLDLIDQQSDSDELVLVDIVHAFEREKRNSIKNYLDEVVPTYTEKEFRMHFRISRDLYLSLSSKFEKSVYYTNSRPDIRIPAATYMAVFLWFAGHEACSFRDVSDRFNLAISSINRIIDETSAFISSLSPEVIIWPSEKKKRESACIFKNKWGFSKAIGKFKRKI